MRALTSDFAFPFGVPLLLLLTLAKNSEAWLSVTPPQTLSLQKTIPTSTTRLHNSNNNNNNNWFDWMNPKNKKESATTVDVFANWNWFQPKQKPQGHSSHENYNIKTKQDTEKAEDFIQNELLDLYKDASVPSHLYDDSRVTAQTRREQAAATAARGAPVPSSSAKRFQHSATAPPNLHSEHPQNPYVRFLEQAEEAIESELSNVYTDASIPQHMYDEARGIKGDQNKASTTTAASMIQDLTQDISTAIALDKHQQQEEGDGIIHTGVVKWFDPIRGYGFLEPRDREDNGVDAAAADDDDAAQLFVHHSGIQDNSPQSYFHKLLPNETVEYQIAYDKYGRTRAVHVTGPQGTPVKAILQQQLQWSPHQRRSRPDK